MVEYFPSFLMAMGVGAVSIAYNVVAQRRTNREISRLKAQLEELQDAQASSAEPQAAPGINADMLELHHQIFRRSPEYAELQNLKYLRDQFVSPRNRDRLMQAVENAYKDELSALRLICPELNAEDCFLGMMSMMKFSTHDIASCLGVSDEAIRKRRSRIRQKLGHSEPLLALLCLGS